MKYTFDTKELKRMRQAQELETDRITIEISKTPMQLHPRVEVKTNKSMNWKTFAWLMEKFDRSYLSTKVTGINRLMKSPHNLTT